MASSLPGAPGGPPKGPPGAPPVSRATTRINIPVRQAPTDPTKFTEGDAELDFVADPFFFFGYPDSKEFGTRWWYQYFATEACSQEARRAPNWKSEFTAVLNLLFFKQAGIPPGKRDVTGRGWWLGLKSGVDSWKTRPAPAPAVEGQPAPPAPTGPDSNSIWREALSKLLKLGFRAVGDGQVMPDGVTLLTTDQSVASEHLLRQRMLGKKVAQLEKSMCPSEVPIYWRSETRDIKRILSQQGTKRQCDVDSIATDMGMSASWHPFSDPALNKYMWFRLANTDNDYYTVISVATDFETACSFPKIDEKRVYQFPPTQVRNWSKDQAELFKSNLGLVLEDGRETIRLITTTTTYMLIHTGSVLDTKGANAVRGKESFPELGVEHIPLENIYCVLPIRRVHHGPKPGDGFTVFIDFMNAQRLHAAKETDLFGIKLSYQLFNIFLEKRRQRPFATAWSETGAHAPAISANITRILEFPLSSSRLQTFKSTLGDTATVASLPSTMPVRDNMKTVMGELLRR